MQAQLEDLPEQVYAQLEGVDFFIDIVEIYQNPDPHENQDLSYLEIAENIYKKAY